MKKWLCIFWQTAKKPSTTISLGIIALGGFIMGILFWGGFNTALEVTNTEEFCISCHEMEDNVYQELQQTVHWKNHSGVRARCADCHVPHNWTDKIARKMQASKEVWGKIFGTINTKEKFEAKRLELAQHEWDRFSANNSLECKNCHDYDSMDFELMSDRARVQMKKAAERDQSCIDCHKGIAHKLPENMGESSGLLADLDSAASGTSFSEGETYFTVRSIDIFGDEALSMDVGELSAATPVKVIAVGDDKLQLELSAWRKTKGFGRVLFDDFGKNIVSGFLTKELAQDESKITGGDKKVDELTGLPWQQVTVNVWVAQEYLVDDIQPVWEKGKEIYDASCSVCHSQPAPAHFDANTWPGMFNGMLAFVNLDGDSQEVVLKYLQKHSSDYSDGHH
jgi:trimethylamine-N-oxide reductase cytochrome c-type subunit TorC